MSDADLTPRRPRLPDVALPPLAGGGAASGSAVPLRAPRRGTVLVLLDEAPSGRDAAYLRQLADAAPALGDWDGRVLVVVEGDGDGDAARRAPEAFEALALPFPVLADPQRAVARAAGVEAPAVVVADQWGEVHAARPAGPEGQWLAPSEVEQWLRFIAVRCGG